MRTGEKRGLRIHQALAWKLGTAIVSGKLKPGGGIGGEIEQSAALKVSRTAYREAVRVLTAKGLVESKPKAGTHDLVTAALRDMGWAKRVVRGD